jgi:hypothetical protein
MVGDVSVDDIRRLFADQAEFCKGKPGIYVIVDLQRMQQISTEARRETARAPFIDGKPMVVHAIAIVGGSFHLRLLGRMINKAAAVLHRVQETSIEFFDTLDQAQQYVARSKGLNVAETRG